MCCHECCGDQLQKHTHPGILIVDRCFTPHHIALKFSTTWLRCSRKRTYSVIMKQNLVDELDHTRHEPKLPMSHQIALRSLYICGGTWWWEGRLQTGCCQSSCQQSCGPPAHPAGWSCRSRKVPSTYVCEGMLSGCFTIKSSCQQSCSQPSHPAEWSCCSQKAREFAAYACVSFTT